MLGAVPHDLAGRTLSDLIAGTHTGLTALPWVNHHSGRWEPQPLRWMGANAGLAVMSSADARERRSGRSSHSAALFGRFLGH